MKANRNEINEKAKEAYQKIFHEEPQKKNLDKEQDVVLNINDLENEVEEMKEKEETIRSGMASSFCSDEI
mgnify:CR=1 FL=1